MTSEDFKTLRETHGLTQRAMGELLGYTANYVSRLERGEEPITARCEKFIRAILRPKKMDKSLQKD
jgi:transcriptional regulator with XRE-family HTH domain